jgi:monoamine oxidase
VSARRSPVIVVGAGAAGLAAAALLSRRGVPVVVLEARDRLGGRIDTRTDPVLGVAIEHGAEFVHGHPSTTLSLARAARAALRSVPERHLRWRAGRLAEGGAALARSQELLALGTRDDEPFEARLRRERRRGASPDAVALARQFVRGFYLADPRSASALALARMTRALEAVQGDRLSRVSGGYARVLVPLVRTLRRRRVELRLSTVVEEVRWRRREVRVTAHTALGGALPPLAGSRAIVTVPVSMLGAGGVRFVPTLPRKRAAAEALAMGPVVKVLLRFRGAPWARLGAPLVFLHVTGAAVPVFWTPAPIEAPLAVGWAGGPDATALSALGRIGTARAALRSLARGLGQRARELERLLDAVTVVDWTRDPFARGGYATFPTGSAAAAEELARSVDGTLFFAGEATAGGLAGTVEGALRSGERAAREVLATS